MMSQPDVENSTLNYFRKWAFSEQEVDYAHSIIEKALYRFEVHNLFNVLKSIRMKPAMRIIQRRKKEFLDFEKESRSLNLSKVPYTSVKKKLVYDIEYAYFFDTNIAMLQTKNTVQFLS